MNFKFTIGRKIGMGFSALIILTFVAFIFTLVTLADGKQKADRVTDVYIPSVSSLKELNLLVARSRFLLYSWLIHEKDDYPDKAKLKYLIYKEYPQLKDKIKSISAYWTQEEKDRVGVILKEIDNLYDAYRQVMSDLNTFENYEDRFVYLNAKTYVEDDSGAQINSILDKLDAFIVQQQANANGVTDKMLLSFESLKFVVRLLSIALVIGGVLIAFFTVRSIVAPIKKLKTILLQMGRGVLPTQYIENRNDEIGEMSVALNGLVEGLRSTTSFANEVGSGNFESYYKPLSDEDTLGQALLKMRTDLEANERVLEQKVIERTEEVVLQKKKIETQNQKLEVLYKHVTDSIRYAKRIQEAILPPDNLVKQLLPKSFVLYKPKDIVSGDFYWLHQKNNKVFFAAIDCTGHGVPGAFMSIVGHNLLEDIVSNTNHATPATILDALNKGVLETLHNREAESTTKDGMDLALCSIDFDKMDLEYAGAYNPLYLIRKGVLQEIKGDKFPVGYFEGMGFQKFTNHNLKIEKGDCIYIFSDGYADQFGGADGKKFMMGKFRNLLATVCNLPIDQQRKILDKTIEEWRGDNEQVDDILVWGVQV